MSHDDRAAALSARPPGGGSADTQMCVLLACFAGAKRAGKVRGQLGKQITSGGDRVLDEVVLKVNAKHRAVVHDPRRTLAGVLTPALTWGIFGLLAGGLRGSGSGGCSAPSGAAYMPITPSMCSPRMSSSASAAACRAIPRPSWLGSRGPDPRRVLSSAASYGPATASAAAIGADLSARAYSGASNPLETSTARAGAAPQAANQATVLSMLLVRFAGEHAARRVLGKSGSAKHQDQKAPQVELVIETNEHGRRRVIAPATGSAAFSKSDTISWGLFGLVWGVIVGFASHGGVLSSLKSALVTGILWAIFGMVAGALYGLWAGRAVSARRLKGVGPLVPPGTSLVVAWAEGALREDTIEQWAGPGSRRLILRFNPAGPGALLEV